MNKQKSSHYPCIPFAERSCSLRSRISPLFYWAGLLFFLLITPEARAQSHPLRVTLGYDASRFSGYTSSGLFGAGYGTREGAARFGISYDVWKDGRSRFTGFGFADANVSISDTIYRGVGFGFRAYPNGAGSSAGNGYMSAGVALYDVAVRAAENGNNVGLGLKLMIGYETRSALFAETGVSLIGVDGYAARPAIVLGLRF